MVLDTSIIVKWIKQLNENDDKKAFSLYQKLQAGEIKVIVPDLTLYELANYASRQDEEIFSACQELISGIFESKIEIVPPTKDLIEDIAILGHKLKISAYDAAYIALAKQFNTKVVTADKKLLTASPEFTEAL